jgi:predicted HicB family RNase H-like nuclease
VLQMVRDMSYGGELQVHVEGNARFMQCRLPMEQYEWLRYGAFINRVSMNSIVLEAIDELRAEIKTKAKAAQATPGTGNSLEFKKFNVRLSEETYEWLRTAAFECRSSINQLLISAITSYRKHQGS